MLVVGGERMRKGEEGGKEGEGKKAEPEREP